VSKPLKNEMVTVRLTADMRASLAAIGAIEQRTLSNVVQLAISRLIAERRNEKGPHTGGPFNV
jgi:hypothetical protein